MVFYLHAKKQTEYGLYYGYTTTFTKYNFKAVGGSKNFQGGVGAPPSREKPACEVTSVTVRGRNKGRSQVITGHFLVLTGQKIVKFSFVWSFSTKK